VKTTIDIPDGLLRRARSAAGREGITLKQLVAEALKQRLRSGAEREPAPWRALAGKLSDLRVESRRIVRAIDREFERSERRPPTTRLFTSVDPELGHDEELFRSKR
jgi:hypothetical protein